MTIPKRSTYRHGNLKAAAVSEALAIIASEAESALTVRGLSERLGVAHRALYNHFPDRDALLRDVAAAGYDRLADALNAAPSRSDFVRAYLDFALANRAIYGLMMRQQNSRIAASPAMRAAIDRVIGTALAALGDPGHDDDSNRRAVMRLWMTLHGGLSLHFANALAPRSDADFIAEMLAIVAG